MVSGKSSKGPKSLDKQESRRSRQDVLMMRLNDLIEADPEGTAVDLTNLALSILAQRYPAILSNNDKERIKDNYPDATDSLISERAMSEQGVVFAIALALQSGRIAIDYFPGSHCKSAMENDDVHGSPAAESLEPQLSDAYQRAVDAGMSPFGVTTMMILMGVIQGLKQGMTWTAIVRPLLDSIEFVIKESCPKPQKEIEEDMIRFLMGQMGISKAQAKRYIKDAKESLDRP